MKMIEVPCEWELDESTGRSEGLHFSDLQRLIMQARDPDKFQELEEGADFDQPTKGRMELGCAFELYDKTRLRKRGIEIIDGVEYVKDGIILTPDGETPGVRLWEFKLTWASANRDLTDWHWYWLIQLKAYCHARDLGDMTLRVANVCGAWNPPTAPMLRQFDFSFKPRELRENWRQLLAYKKKAGRKSTHLKGVRS